MKKAVKLPDGTRIPAIGEGTWYLGENPSKFEKEKESLIVGAESGLTLIDTAEMYGSGQAEILIGKAMERMNRSKLFLVSKVYPHNAGRKHIFTSCQKSLQRLKTDYLDLYLLHWRGNIPLEETVDCLEQLIKQGKIRRWGVSNFDTDDMEELWQTKNGQNCAINQVLYHMASRGVEFDLLPWLINHKMPLMAYCPLAQGGSLRQGLYSNTVLKRIAANHEATVASILLAFVIRSGHVIAIPRTGSSHHAEENAAAAAIELTDEELHQIDTIYPGPTKKVPLDMQ